MYATLHRTTGAPPAGHGPSLRLRLRQIGGPIGLTVQLWPERPADPTAYEVVEDRRLTEPDATPVAASVVTFDGPLSDDVLKAAERAGRERITPAMAGHPGGVRLIALLQPELRRHVIITLATSLESLEEAGRKIAGLPLLPGEDVALLPRPRPCRDVPGGVVGVKRYRSERGLPGVRPASRAARRRRVRLGRRARRRRDVTRAERSARRMHGPDLERRRGTGRRARHGRAHGRSGARWAGGGAEVRARGAGR